MPDYGIKALGEALKGINPNGGLNPHGNCMHCAIETAMVLSGEHMARAVDGSIAAIDLDDHAHRVFANTTFRARRVFQWLIGRTPGVYVVDAGDHAYNFVRTIGALYLVDSNQYVFRRIRSQLDFLAVGHNATVNERYGYNYADPTPDDDDDDLTIYFYHALSPKWTAILSGTAPIAKRVGSSLGGAHIVD